MSTRFFWLLPGSMLILAGAACNGGSFSFSYHDHRPAKTRHVHRTHVCTKACHHHYYDGTRVVALKGHRHGPGCGHVWNGRHWVVARKAPRHAPVVHVCSRGCHHHYHNGTKLVALKGHRHGPGCGHRWNGKHWVLAKAKTGPVKGKARPHTASPQPKKKKVKPSKTHP